MTQPIAMVESWERGSDILAVQPRVLCGECNNSWMSSLEDAASPLIVAAIDGTLRKKLESDDQNAISTWALSAAIVRSYAASQIPALDEDLRSRFRTAGLPGKDVTVGLAHLAWDLDIRNSSPVASTVWAGLDSDDDCVGHLIVFWLANLGVIVGTGAFASRTVKMLDFLEGASIRTWPIVGPASWPPRAQVTDRVLLRALDVRVDEAPAHSFDVSNIGRGKRTAAVIRLEPGILQR